MTCYSSSFMIHLKFLRLHIHYAFPYTNVVTTHSLCIILLIFFHLSINLFFLNKFIYLFIFAVLGLRFCVRAFSSCGEQGPLFIAVRGPLTLAASPVAEHRLQTRRLSSCGSRAQSLRSM